MKATRVGEDMPFIGETLQLAYRGSNFITPDPSLGLTEDDAEAIRRREGNSFSLVLKATVQICLH